MTDVCTAKQRSQIMSRIRSKNTGPEMIVRRLVYGMGYRYRLHVATLPGKPDIVMADRKKVIDVRGCFWHGHQGCQDGRIPKSRVEYWTEKISKNIERDIRNLKLLQQEGWKVLIVWECELKDIDALREKLRTFIGEY